MNERTRHQHASQFRQPPSFNQPHPFHHQTPYHSQQQYTPYELFAKPPQPLDLLNTNQNTFEQSQNQSSMPGVFTDANGQVDFEKMMGTINQLASTYHQVSPIVKQISSLLRMFRT